MADPRPLERRLGALAQVTDPSRLLECHQTARQQRFQHLVRCYLSQILHGCKSAYCTTPTCLSCKKRLVTKPHRPPTQLTARILAHYLASQDDPRRGLCPHELKVDPATFEIEAAASLTTCLRGPHPGPTCNVYPKEGLVTSPSLARKTRIDQVRRGAAHGQGREPNLADAIAERHQAKIDPKSLGQNLYDTNTMIFAYSKPLPSPLSVFITLRSLEDSKDGPIVAAAQTQSGPPSNIQRTNHSHQIVCTNGINGHATPPVVNGSRATPETASKPASRTRRRPSIPNADLVTSELSRDGHMVHKIRHIPDHAGGHRSSRKFAEYPSPEGANEARSPKSKMRRRPSPLDSSTKPGSLVDLASPATDPALNYSATAGSDKIRVVPYLTCDIMEKLKEEVYHHRDEQACDFSYVVDYDANRIFRPAKPFVNRSLFYSLSDPETLLKSFRDGPRGDCAPSPLPHLDSYGLANAFRDWNQRNGALIFDSLCISVEALSRPPPELCNQKSPRLKPSRKGAASPGLPPHDDKEDMARYLSDDEVAHIVMICVHALTSLVTIGRPHTWVQIRNFRGWGVIIPRSSPNTDAFAYPWLRIIDELEYEPAVRLASRLLRALGARFCFEEVLYNLRIEQHDDHGGRRTADTKRPCPPGTLAHILVQHLEAVEQNALGWKAKLKATQDTSEDPGWTVTATFMEWLRTTIIKEWDGKAVIRKWSAVGAAFALMSCLRSRKRRLNIRGHSFHIPYLNERIDAVQAPVDFLKFSSCPNTAHVLEFPFLFRQEYLVGYFRTINLTTMLTQFDHSTRTSNLQNRLGHVLPSRYTAMMRNHLKASFTDYLLLQVGRENTLKETLDQLWGQEKRMLLKPLKVRVGMHEGEVGFDQGGVTCEFFRLVLNDAFEADKGLFTVDPVTRMSWFQPAAFEPDWKFQMLGVLFSIAVYNGITLPVTFPLVLYEHLLAKDPYSRSKHLNTDTIRDGWPALAKSFDQLLAYDGNVADVYMRDYVFSFEAFGQVVDVDMQAFEGHKRWPARSGPPHPGRFESANAWRANLKRPALTDPAWRRPTTARSESGDDSDMERDSDAETPLVTNENREKFVSDYIHWLVYRSVERQISAFATGFHTCLNRRSLDLFTPKTLRKLVEGSPVISVPLLRKSTRYEGKYNDQEPTIVNFWSIVESYSQDEVKRLLEFVTASERVPITGFENMNFVIEPGGGDTDRLPTSSTCFGKLYLPAYATKEKMREKLGLALQNCKGFGNV